MFTWTNVTGCSFMGECGHLNGCMTPVDNDAVVVNESTPATNENATSWTEKLAQGYGWIIRLSGCYAR